MNSYHRYWRAAKLPQHGRAWLDALEASGRSTRTLATYAAALVNLRRFLGAKRSTAINGVTTADLEAWQRAMARNGCPLSSQEQFVRTVRYWFQWLHARAIVFTNPAAALRLPKLEQRLPRCPSEDQMRQLLRAMPRQGAVALRNRALLELAYASGARLDELARLKISSIDCRDRTVRLHGKGARDRTVPLTRHAVRALNHYLKRARARLLDGADHDGLFVGIRDGEQLRSPGIAGVIREAGARVALEITPHAIRRAFATHLLRGGAHPTDLMLLLGHRGYRHLGRYLRANALRHQLHRR